MNWKHRSTDANYRTPLGAVRTEEDITVILEAEGRPEEFSAEYQVFLIMECADRSIREYSLNHIEMIQREPDFCKSRWGGTFTVPAVLGVCWYYFRIYKEGDAFFYGAQKGRTSGLGEVCYGIPPCYQLTVYERGFQTPEWFRNATMYQIFPDRYCRGDRKNLKNGMDYHQSMGRTVAAHANWEEIPYYQQQAGEPDYYPEDFFGGDLAGIIKNLDELDKFGINCIYLNPIVEADSNHRYNTADYKKVDPILGTNEDFKKLCKEAGKRGIRILLDGVYSHTGADSIYFNKKENYPEPGAYQQAGSPYDKWYIFYGNRDNYRSWWGFESLPEVNEYAPSWQDYVVTGEDSVFQHWLDLGAYGYRLDVADELPDEVIEKMRAATKKANPDHVLLGEVWEDATTKESYGVKRTYALGNALDSVMNYPFRDMVISWLTGWIRTEVMADFLNAQSANYPKPMYYALMNLISSHDVARIRTVLGAGTEGKELNRLDQASFVLDHGHERKGKRLSRLAMALQFVLPGVPSVYYGDEYGMTGFGDPFNRGTFEKKDTDIADYAKKLSHLRKGQEILRNGAISACRCAESILAVLRCPETDGIKDCILTLLNRKGETGHVRVSLSYFIDGLTLSQRKGLSVYQNIEVLLYARKRSIEQEAGWKLQKAKEGDVWVEGELQPYDVVILRLSHSAV